MPDELDHHHYFNLSQMGSEKRIQAFLDYLKEYKVEDILFDSFFLNQHSSLFVLFGFIFLFFIINL